MLHHLMYADFESVLKPRRSKEGGDGEPWTVKKQCHIVDGFACYVKCSDKRIYEKPFVHTGENAAEQFIDQMLRKAGEIRSIY